MCVCVCVCGALSEEGRGERGIGGERRSVVGRHQFNACYRGFIIVSPLPVEDGSGRHRQTPQTPQTPPLKAPHPPRIVHVGALISAWRVRYQIRERCELL